MSVTGDEFRNETMIEDRGVCTVFPRSSNHTVDEYRGETSNNCILCSLANQGGIGRGCGLMMGSCSLVYPSKIVNPYQMPADCPVIVKMAHVMGGREPMGVHAGPWGQPLAHRIQG